MISVATGIHLAVGTIAISAARFWSGFLVELVFRPAFQDTNPQASCVAIITMSLT
jgi:hypothetical protein